MLALVMMLTQPKINVPEPLREFRAVWVATVDNIDWPSRPGLSTKAMKSELLAIINKCEYLHLNAILLQVRPSADALYNSSIEPWSYFLTGKQGVGPTDFDPLQFAIEESHRRGIELHAWCNPYRAMHPAQKSPNAAMHISQTNPELVKEYGSYLWLDPGHPKVQERTFQVFMDLVKRYDIDGIHIDDYFYPYPVKVDGKTVPFPDDKSWNMYKDSGGRLSRSDWRRKNVDDFIQKVYKEIKKVKPSVKFGISPFGIYRPGVPTGIEAGMDQYAELYADARKWLNLGWCDYFAPQLYWPIDQKPQAFDKLLTYWLGENDKDRYVFPGLYTSRTNPSNGDWPADEVINQLTLIRISGSQPGAIHFSMKPLMKNWNGITSNLAKAYATPALPPAYPWLDKSKPESPKVQASWKKGEGLTVNAKSTKPSDVRFYVFQLSGGSVHISSDPVWKEPTVGHNPVWAAVSVLDRAGNLSKPQVFGMRRQESKNE